MKKKIICIIGTRPEALKMAPLILELYKSLNFEVKTLVTAQHRELIDQMMTLFDIQVDKDLNIMAPNQSLGELSAKLLLALNQYFLQEKPDMVIAQGDTTTTMIAAMASFYLRIPFAHVEAGLRSFDLHSPFPEEFNRQCAAKLATLHFAPTQTTQQNLLREGVKPESIFITGNTIIDTLYYFSHQAGNTNPIEDNSKLILVTCHRRENFGDNLINICQALQTIARQHKDVTILFPVHPNPNVRNVVYELLQNEERIQLCAPIDYKEMVAALKRCYLVLTDSGGLQEEAPALGKPVLVMRTETERPEAVEYGASRLVGVLTNDIVHNVEELLTNAKVYESMAKAGSPYGNGTTAKQIASILLEYFKE
ncbi:MAG: wecB [Gammaproteobacteria bacterium]|jgi:UDP-N-acetylglucosamine 2-epimerase (non-hydrolysing)|nr:wecB [Gammaproteobacteria bacterium]